MCLLRKKSIPKSGCKQFAINQKASLGFGRLNMFINRKKNILK